MASQLKKVFSLTNFGNDVPVMPMIAFAKDESMQSLKKMYLNNLLQKIFEIMVIPKRKIN